jgi:hypothetical protein
VAIDARQLIRRFSSSTGSSSGSVKQNTRCTRSPGAQRVHPDHAVWAKPLGSMTSGTRAVLLVNRGGSSAAASVHLRDLGLLSNARVRDLWLRKDLGSVAGEWTAQLAPHASRPLRVEGEFNWVEGATFEAEWPGNARSGGTRLLACGECSRGFAVSLGAVDAEHGGSLTLDRVDVPEAGDYRLVLTWVRNGLGDKMIGVAVNGGTPVQIKALMREWNWVTVPVKLHAGANTITISCEGNDTFDIGIFRLRR